MVRYEKKTKKKIIKLNKEYLVKQSKRFFVKSVIDTRENSRFYPLTSECIQEIKHIF